MALKQFKDSIGDTNYLDAKGNVYTQGGSYNTQMNESAWNDRQTNKVATQQKSQITSLSDNIAKIDKEIAKRDKAYTEAVTIANDNPFYSESTRVGRIAKADEKYQMDVGNKIRQKQAIQDQLNAYNAQIQQNQEMALKNKEANKPGFIDRKDANGNTVLTAYDPYTGKIISQNNLGGGKAPGQTANDIINKAKGSTSSVYGPALPPGFQQPNMSVMPGSPADTKPRMSIIPGSPADTKSKMSVMPASAPAQNQNYSVGGFVSNVGRDIGENIQGLLSIPGVLWNIGTGKINAGDAGSAVATGIYNDYKDLVTKPIDTSYNKPITTILNVLPFLQAAKATKARFAGKAAEAAKVVSTAGEGASAISKIGEAANTVKRFPGTALRGVGKEFQSTVRGFEDVVAGDPFFKSNVDELTKVADEFKLTGSASSQIQKGGKAFETLTKEVETKLAADAKTISKAELKSRLVSELEQTPYYMSGDPKFETATKKVLSIIDKSTDGEDLKYLDVYKGKQTVGNRFKASFNKDPNRVTLSEIDITAMETYDILRKIVDEGVPGVSALTKKQSALFDITKALKRKLNKPTVSAGALTPQAPGIARATQAMTDVAGRALTGAGNMVDAGISGAAKTAQTVASPVTANIARQFPMTSQAIESTQPQPDQSQQMQQSQQDQPTFESQGYTPDVLWTAIMMDQSETGGQNYTELKRLYDLAVEEEKRGKATAPGFNDLTDKQRSFVGASMVAGEALRILEEDADKLSVGPVAGRFGGLGAATGMESPEMTTFRSKIASARTVAKNALLGAAMSEQETESLLDATFDITLPANILERRLKAFIDDMQTYAYGTQGGSQ